MKYGCNQMDQIILGEKKTVNKTKTIMNKML